jgi:hypothetical protein
MNLLQSKRCPGISYPNSIPGFLVPNHLGPQSNGRVEKGFLDITTEFRPSTDYQTNGRGGTANNSFSIIVYMHFAPPYIANYFGTNRR